MDKGSGPGEYIPSLFTLLARTHHKVSPDHRGQGIEVLTGGDTEHLRPAPVVFTVIQGRKGTHVRRPLGCTFYYDLLTMCIEIIQYCILKISPSQCHSNVIIWPGRVPLILAVRIPWRTFPPSAMVSQSLDLKDELLACVVYLCLCQCSTFQCSICNLFLNLFPWYFVYVHFALFRWVTLGIHILLRNHQFPFHFKIHCQSIGDVFLYSPFPPKLLVLLMTLRCAEEYRQVRGRTHPQRNLPSKGHAVCPRAGIQQILPESVNTFSKKNCFIVSFNSVCNVIIGNNNLLFC